MFAKPTVFRGLNRVVRLGMLAVAGVLSAPVALHAQNAINQASVTPPAGVSNSGTTCTQLGSSAAPTTRVELLANGVCRATDEDPRSLQSDLGIVKNQSADNGASFVASPITVNASATVQFRIVVTNHGPSTVTGATFTDAVPGNFTALSVVGTPTAGAGATQCAATITGGTLSGQFSGPKDATCSVIVQGTATGATGGTGVNNTATVAVPTGVTDPEAGNNSSTVNTVITAPQLRLTKAANPSPFVVGVSASYVLTLTNEGSGATTAAATITDPVPAGLTLGTLPTGCTASGQTVTCTVPAGLAAGATASFTIPVTATATAASPVINTATVTGGGDTTCPSDERCRGSVSTPVLTPSLELTKTAAVAADQSAITYSFSVSNTGNVELTNVVVSDPRLPSLSCPAIATLAAGTTQALTCTGNVYTVLPADLNTGSVSNTAHAEGTPPGGGTPVGDDSTVTTPLTQSPSLELTKTAAVAADQSAITYSFSVSNTGNVDLTNVVVSDPRLPGLSCPAIATLAAGTTQALTCTGNVYTVLPADLNAGSVSNTAHAEGTPPGGGTPVGDDATVTTPLTQSPSLELTKTAAVAADQSAITYSFSVSNTGNVDLTNVVVSDPRLPGLSCPAIATLAAGTTQALTCTGNVYTVLPADLNAGSVSNTAHAEGTPPGGGTPVGDDSTVTTPLTQSPSLELTKTAAVAADQSAITYSFSVSNTGNVDLTNVVVSDPRLPGLSCPAIATLAAGTTQALTCTGNVYTVLPADLNTGSVSNTAHAEGTPPGGGTPVGDDSTVTTPLTQSPSLTIVKSADKSTYATLGEVITYSYVVTNNGNVTINGITVSDDKIATVSCPVSTLAPTEATTCTATYTISQPDLDAGFVTNVATADGTPIGGTLTPPKATVTVNKQSHPINAENDTLPAVGGSTGGNTPSVLVNDTLNGVPVTTGTVDLKTTGVANDGTALGLTTPPANGSITMNPDGTLTIAPGTTAGTYSYTYEICETLNPSNCDTAVATVVVGASAIVASNDSANTAQNTPVTVSVLGNDTLDGLPTDPTKVTITQVSTPSNGSVVINSDGTVTYTPNPGYSGTDTFTYQICENLNPGNCATATVTITVLPNQIEAIDDSGTTDPNTPVTTPVIGNDTSTGTVLDPTSVTVVTPPANGTTTVNPDGSVTYTPNPNYSGTDTYQYQVCDTSTPTPVCDTATVTITVTPNRIDAVDDEGRTQADTPVTINVIGNDTTQSVPLDPNSLTVVTQPANGSVTCTAGSCVYTPNPGFIGQDSFVYRVCDLSVPTPVCDTATVNLTVEGGTRVRVTKQANPRDVKVGDLVRYTVTMENIGDADVIDGTLVDTPPPGFNLVEGSVEVADRDGVGRLAGSYPIRVDQIDIATGGRATITYLLRVGAGVRAGLHTNAAEVHDNGSRVSNVATASVQMVADPMTGESTLLGTVFDDRDSDGWQDSAEMTGVHIQGGFAAGAYIANSTTVDRGAGPQPEADASSPLLHGIAIGTIGGRQSDADPAQARQVVVSQLLRSPEFTSDLVLTTKQGVTLRMDAAGRTEVSNASGDAAKGLTAALPSVERRVSQTEGGYRVDYVIRNDGVDERGIPGVRIASVEGLLVETDQYGRYNLIGVDGGREERGRNFILKVDPATLPPGSVFTTANPLVRRITPGLPVRFDFGVKLPPGLVKGEGSQQVDVELGEVMFTPASAEIRSQYQPAIDKMAEQIRAHDGGDIIVAAHGEDELLAFDRAVAVRKALVAALPGDVADRTRVSLRTNPRDEQSTVVGLLSWPELGNVLFDTDQSSIKPQYLPLLGHIGKYLMEMDSRVVKITGHADRRASDAYNDALGLRRAKAVYEAITAQLPQAQRGDIRVEIVPGGSNAPDARADQEAKP